METECFTDDQLVRLDPGTPYNCHNPDQTITRICPLCNLNFKLKGVSKRCACGCYIHVKCHKIEVNT